MVRVWGMVCDDVGAFLLPKMIFRKMMRVCVFAAHLASFLEDALYGRVVRVDRAQRHRRRNRERERGNESGWAASPFCRPSRQGSLEQVAL